MPGIREQLSITDGFSQTFRAFQSAADSATQSADGLNSSIDDFGNNSSLDRFIAQLDDVTKVLADITSEQRQVTEEVKRTSESVGKWLNGLKSVISSMGGMKLAKEFIEEADAMSEMQAKLNAINDGLQTTDQLNKMIFASAQRSRGSYQDTANLVARLGMNAAEAFSSNQEAITFAENLNKAFKIAGASGQEQASVILQLSQALAGGALRGQEFNAVMSGAPNVIREIADYMGVPVGEMRDLAAEGKVTAEIVKNALISATDDINAQFEQMPQTWGSIIQSGKNYLIFGLQEAFADWQTLLNSEQFQQVMDTLLNGVIAFARAGASVIKGVANAVIWVRDHWATLAPVIYGAVTAIALFKVTSMAAAIASAASWAMSHWWLFALAALLVQVASVAGKMGLKFEDVGRFIGGVFGALYAFVYNVFADIWNVVAIFVEFFANVWSDPLGSIARMFVALADVVLSTLEWIADAMDWVFGTSKGDTIRSWREDMKNWAIENFGEANVHVERMEKMSYADSAISFGQKGADIAKGIEGIVDSLTGEYSAVDEINGQLAGLTDSITDVTGPTGEVANVGSVGEIKNDVNLAEEDIKILRDLAEMKYMQKVELQTLAPNITVSIEEAAAGTLSAEDVASKIQGILIEQAAAHTATAH